MDAITINPLWIEIGLPALGIGLALGLLLTWLFMRRKRLLLEDRIKTQDALQQERQQALDAANTQLMQAFNELSNRSLKDNSESFLRLAEQHLNVHNEKAKRELSEREKAVESLVKPIRDALEMSKKQIDELEKSRSEAYGSIRSQLEAMHTSQRLLKQETQNLVNALRRPEVRGRWGEITLRRLVELAGMVEHCDFQEQVHSVGEGQVIRPDLIVNLPDGGQLVVDVKTPLDAYLEAAEAKDDVQRKLGLERHAKNVRAHIRTLSAKAYWGQFEQSPEFVILFIPGDQFLSAALDRDHALLEDALANKVVLATPTSLVALLRAVGYGWRQAVLAENAEHIRQVGEEVYSRLGTFAEHLGRLGKSLDSSVSAYNKAVGSFDSRVLPGLRKFTEMGISAKKEAGPLDQIERAPRQVEAGDEGADDTADTSAHESR